MKQASDADPITQARSGRTFPTADMDVRKMNLSPSSSLMSSDRDDLRNPYRGLEGPFGLHLHRRPDFEASHLAEARVQQLARHLRALGRLNVYILAREWNCSPGEVIHALTQLHHAGRLERTDQRPYFRVVGTAKG